jgi:hypothetical protein
VLVGAFAGLPLVLAPAGVSESWRFFRQPAGARIRYPHGTWCEIRSTLVLRRGLAIASAGIVAGLASAVARVLETLLFGIKPLDLVTFSWLGRDSGFHRPGGLCRASDPRSTHESGGQITQRISGSAVYPDSETVL